MTASMMTISNTCYYFDTQCLCDPMYFENGIALLPWAERKEKVASYQFEEGQRLCLGTGLLLRYALKKAGVSDLTLAHNVCGKPELAFPPEGECHFNCSHSGTLAACVVSPAPVGVDVEQLKPRDPKIAPRVFTPREQAWLSAGNFEERFFLLWTRKESRLKMLGTGFHRPANSIDVLDDSCTDFAFCHHAVPGYQLTVCSNTRDCVWKEVSLDQLMRI